MSVSYLSQLRVTMGALGSCAPISQVPVLGLAVEGPFVEGQTIKATVQRGGSLVGTCSVGVELVGLAADRLVDPTLQRVSSAPARPRRSCPGVPASSSAIRARAR